MDSLLHTASKWKLDASQEDIQRYFFRMNAFEDLLEEKKSLVVGRKGSGKTAISEYIKSQEAWNKFVSTLSFKDFPFNDLYQLGDTSFATPSQYIPLWRFLIYSTLCWMMARDESSPPEVRSELHDKFKGDPSLALDRTFSSWINSSFNLSILGTGGGINQSKANIDNTLSWQERANILEDYVISNITSHSYNIIFDELHEDYSGIEGVNHDQNYFFLLRGLLRAVLLINARLAKSNSNVHIIVLLRDDIYDVIKDPDKNKWSDNLLELSWSRHELFRMVNHRICVDENSEFNMNSIKKIIAPGSRRSKLTRHPSGLFDYIMDSGHHRPRDVLKFIQVASKEAINQEKDIICSDIITAAELDYSVYFRQELFDEMHTVLPNLMEILDLFPRSKQGVLNSDEFIEFYNKSGIGGGNPLSSENVIHVLYYFSAIGCRLNKVNYRYINRSARLVLPARIEVHPGLRRCLFF